MALELYNALADPVVRDFGLVPLVFQSYGLKMVRRDIGPLLQRLSAIHVYARDRADRQRKDANG